MTHENTPTNISKGLPINAVGLDKGVSSAEAYNFSNTKKSTEHSSIRTCLKEEHQKDYEQRQITLRLSFKIEKDNGKKKLKGSFLQNLKEGKQSLTEGIYDGKTQNIWGKNTNNKIVELLG